MGYGQGLNSQTQAEGRVTDRELRDQQPQSQPPQTPVKARASRDRDDSSDQHRQTRRGNANQVRRHDMAQFIGPKAVVKRPLRRHQTTQQALAIDNPHRDRGSPALELSGTLRDCLRLDVTEGNCQAQEHTKK